MQLSPKVGQECERPILSEALSRTGSHNLQDGKGKGSHQHRRHWPRRLWQVNHHWSFDLPMWWNRQAYHREIRKGSPRGKYYVIFTKNLVILAT